MTAQRPIRSLLSLLLALVIFSAPLTLNRYVVERPFHTLYFEFTAFIIYLSDIYAGLFVLATAVWLALKRNQLRLGPPALTIPLLLLPVAALASSHWATDPALAAHFATRLLLLFLLYLAIINLHPSQTMLQAGVAAVVILQGITAVLQFWRQHNLGLAWLGEIPIEPVGGFSILEVNQTIWLRAYGLTPHPNILGGLLAALFLLISVLFLEANGRWRWLWGGTAVIGLGGILFSFSRSAWLGLLIAGIILFSRLMAQTEKRRRYLRLTLPLTIVGLIALSGFVWTQRDLLLSRLTRPANVQEARSVSERQALNQIALSLIQENPWRGVGAGQFSYHVDTYTSQFPDIEPQPAHNMPLLLTAELGIFGGALWLWLMLLPLIIAWRQGKQWQLWAWGLTLALAVFAITDLFDFYSWHWQQGRVIRWLLFGLWADSIYNQRKSVAGATHLHQIDTN